MAEQTRRKYNDPNSLDELCKSFLIAQDADNGAAIEYCRNFLTLLNEKPVRSGAFASSRAKSR